MFFLSEGVDDGDIIGRIEIDIADRETAATLYEKHLAAHVELIRQYAPRLIAGTAPRVTQDHQRATIWPRRTPEDGRVDWNQSVEEVDRLIRAVTRPYPGAFTDTPFGRVTIWRGEPVRGHDQPPGSWVLRDGNLLVGCGGGCLRVLEAEGPIEELSGA
jgi:methionyl-tRNA formyltransferase